MFFEASRFGCRKMNFDVTKATYSTYSCIISGMSREIMKMDDRDSAEYQIWEMRDIVGIFKFDLSHKKTKQGIVLHLPHFEMAKT